jgi:hypothetical protein
MFLRIIILLALCFSFVTSAWGFTSRTERWKEDAVLHDGRLINVEREADQMKKFYLLDPFFGLLPFFPRVENYGFNKFRLKFKHPDTKETIEWQGEQNFRPVLLDIVDGIPFLVLYGEGLKDTETIYGCPELPYTYLKYKSGFFGEWSPVPVEKAPDVLREANLSPQYPDFGYINKQYEARETAQRGGRPPRDMSSDEVQKQIIKEEQRRAGFFQHYIPRTYQEWNYKEKNHYLNERTVWECRPPRIPPPEVVLPVATEGSVEILETISYSPTSIVARGDWSKLVFDQTRENECKKLFKPTDLNDYMKGQRFVNDSTGNNPAPYSRSAQFNSGVRVLCDDHVWFITHMEEPGKIIITKYKITGDLVYRASFQNPDRVEGFVGYIRVPSLRSEAGYLYFDWLDFREIDHEWHIRRWLKMRMMEP